MTSQWNMEGGKASQYFLTQRTEWQRPELVTGVIGQWGDINKKLQKSKASIQKSRNKVPLHLSWIPRVAKNFDESIKYNSD
jgi:hypothetical protein